MKTQKVLTNKQGLQSLIINDLNIVVKKTNGEFGIYDSSSTKTTIPTSEQLDFDELPFIEAFNKWEIAKVTKEFQEKQEQEKKIEQTRLNEEKRILDLKERISKCETPRELSDEFGLSIIETASHWSDLYKGHSKYAVQISNREEFEIMEMAQSIYNIDGSFGESKKRAGEHHHTFDKVYNGMDGYQKYLKTHFSGNNYFYKSQENCEDFYMEQIKEASDIEEVKKIISNFDELEGGYYDCNGNLEITDEELNDDDLSGYSQDVYHFSFSFQFDYKNSFSEIIEEEEEEEV